MLVINVQIKEAKFVPAAQSAFVYFTYNKTAISKIKQIPGRRFIPDEKCWEIPENQLDTLSEVFKEDKIFIKYPKLEEVEVPKNYIFKTPPLPHQFEGIKYGLNHNKFLLADEQGLGKTFQTLHIAAIRKYLYRDNHTLIICGVNGLKRNWLDEVNKHTYEKARIIGERFTKKGKPKAISMKDKLIDLDSILDFPEYFLITNIESFENEIFTEKISQLCKQGFINTILFDEVHRCKNPDSIASKNLLEIASQNYICMTGTPIINNPLDAYMSLCLIGVEDKNYWRFRNKYTIFKKITPKGKKPFNLVVGYQNLEEIQQKIENFYLRRKKEDVLTLPDKIYVTERIEMFPKQEKLYNALCEDILTDTSIKTLDNALAKFTRLRQVTSAPSIVSEIQESVKIERMRQIVEDRVANNRKVIVFTNWAEVAKVANKVLKEYMPALMIGEVKDREAQINKFKTDDKCKVIIGTMSLLGTGYTLTEADTVIFLESPWTKALKNQAEDRAHRIGTKYPVTVITLVCDKTVDERVEEIVQNKTDMTNILIEFKSVGKLVEYMLK